MKILSLIPPMTQLNTPYPSTAYLTGFLRSQGHTAVQADLALALVLELLSPAGLTQLYQAAQILVETTYLGDESLAPHCVQAFLMNYAQYYRTILPTIRFLQGADATLAHRIASRDFLPEGPRFAPLNQHQHQHQHQYEHQQYDATDEATEDSLAWAFGALGTQDKAKHIATLYLNDLADVIREAIDQRFEFVRYAESLAASQPHFDPLALALAGTPTLVDSTLERLTLACIAQHQPTLVLISVPFPGTVYAAFRMAQSIKRDYPHIKLSLIQSVKSVKLVQLG
jgi:hypothetical protein